MAEYRAFVFCQNAHVIGSHDLDCENDDQALEQARRWRVEHTVEVWQRARLVGTLKSGGGHGDVREHAPLRG